jgi:hypothetical protein
MPDSLKTTRTREIHLEDESIIDLTMAIAINTNSAECIANERINSNLLLKTVAFIEEMLITSLELSEEEVEEASRADES